jgi:sec-independent protein translocase protein TatB
MFDIGFSELVMIAVVALVVLGPERLPKVARTMGHLLGRLQRYASDVKADINREIQLDELKKIQIQLEESARKAEQTMREEVAKTESQLRTVAVGGTAQPPEPDAETPADTAPQPTASAEQSVPEQAAPAPSPQLELGLEVPPPGHEERRA